MNTTFDYGAKQLSEAEQELSLIRNLASEIDNPVVNATVEVLEGSMLEHYFELCDLVAQNPDIIRFCTRALERAEVLDYIASREDLREASHATATKLGQIASRSSVQLANYEAFFELFAHDEPAYLSYRARLNQTESIRMENSSAGHPEEIEAPVEDIQESELEQPPEEVTQPEPETEPEFELTPVDLDEVFKEEAPLAIKINGETAELDRIEQIIIQIAIENGRTELKRSQFIQNEVFVAEIDLLAGKSMSTSGYGQRLVKHMDHVNNRFPDLFLRTGEKGGAKIHLSDKYSVEIVEDSVDSEASSATETAAVESEAISAKVDKPEVDETEAKKPAPFGMTSTTKLLERGVMIDRRVTEFLPSERAIIGILSSAPRKQPYSHTRIAAMLNEQGLDGKSAKHILENLAQKLPDGWLISEKMGKDMPVGWRLGKGIRIVKQHT